ncbi:MAG: CHAT domain-containing protein [Cyanobacteria bacterium J06629_19]
MRAFSIWRYLRLLILSVLAVVCCWCVQWWQPLVSAAVASSPAQLVQQGVDAYRDSDYLEAINRWEGAIAQYSPTENSPERAIVLENLARAYRQTGDPTESLGYWQSATAVYTALQNWQKVGRLLIEQAQTYSQLGQPYQAIGLLCVPVSETTIFETIASESAQVSDRQAAECDAQSAVKIAQDAGDAIAQVAAFGSLGEAYRAIKNYPLALQSLQTGVLIANQIAGEIGGETQVIRELAQYQALLQNSLGTLYKEQSELSYQQAISAQRSVTGLDASFFAAAEETDQIALGHFEQSQQMAQQLGNATLEVKALLGKLAVYSHAKDSSADHLDRKRHVRTQAISRWAQLLPTQEKVYLALQLTKQRKPLFETANTSISSRTQCRDIVTDAATQSLLREAHDLAVSLQNNRLKAFTQGETGHYYECEGDYVNALDWSQQAQLSASGDRVLALDTLYLWQWQSGRIYRMLGQLDSAVDFYSQAVTSLNRVRSEILASNQTLQFDFRDAVAPVYRELANIQLSLVPEPLEAISLSNNKTDNQRQNITAALGNIDDLQLAELQNYFGSDCIVPVSQRRLDEMLAATTATEASELVALVSTVIFPDRTAVVLTLPGQMPLLHWIEVREGDLRTSIIAFRNGLEDTSNELEGYDTRQAQRLYQQFIEPFRPALARFDIKTLVFVNDGILRNIPMAALYDGSQYLMEQYALAIAPSLQRPVDSARNSIPSKALVLGLSKNPTVNGRDLGALPAVRREVQEVVSLLPNSELLLNEAFTTENLKSSLSAQSYPVLHIATHGKFETEPNNTFLVTGDKESSTTDNKVLRLGELDSLIRSGAPQEGLLDLIVLSACQTGSGDERSTLGLAGVTIRAGADTAVASLWSVDDESTADLITYFYQNWDSGLSKAEALRQAQITVMQDRRYLRHPAYWSAFMLVGDWQ